MRPLHKIAKPHKVYETFKYVMVHNGFIYACDGIIAVKIPTSEIFCAACIPDNEKLFFLGTEWRAAKMDKAVTYQREGMYFTALDKNNNRLGIVEAHRPDGSPEGLWKQLEGFFNDPLPTVPTAEIFVDAEALSTLSEVLGSPLIKIDYRGDKKSMLVTCKANNSVGLICPLVPWQQNTTSTKPAQQ